eukprot:gene4355-20575_t
MPYVLLKRHRTKQLSLAAGIFCYCDATSLNQVPPMLDDALRHDALRHDASRHDASRHDASRHDASRHDASRHDASCHDALFCVGHAFLKLTLQQSTPNMQKDILPVLHIQAIRKPRRKRGIDCGTGSQRRCCRAPLKISFKDIGYANIILAPASFDAYVCTGQCGTFSRHTSTRVNVVKDYNSFRNRNEKSGLVKFCCTATKTSALTVLLKDGKFVFSKKISGMVIEECSCN